MLGSELVRRLLSHARSAFPLESPLDHHQDRRSSLPLDISEESKNGDALHRDVRDAAQLHQFSPY
jgi:hypothetical protein